MTADQAHRRRKPGVWWGLAVFAAAVVVTAVVGTLAAAGAAEQYNTLRQPGWAPPSWLFGPVWTILYAMIALSGWLVWRAVGLGKQIAVYAVQLVLNAAWTPLFFGGELFAVAFADIVALWILIVATIALFWPVSKLAALLLVPYWAWVTFASALNYSIWQLNN